MLTCRAPTLNNDSDSEAPKVNDGYAFSRF